ncbi:MAG: hypothetical protein Q9195_001212 [Heterodermia aff. obscurata]
MVISLVCLSQAIAIPEPIHVELDVKANIETTDGEYPYMRETGPNVQANMQQVVKALEDPGYNGKRPVFRLEAIAVHGRTASLAVQCHSRLIATWTLTQRKGIVETSLSTLTNLQQVGKKLEDPD